MKNLINDYIQYCKMAKKLCHKTLQAYFFDLMQYYAWISSNASTLTNQNPIDYITFLNEKYSSTSVKRKIASLRGFFSWAQSEGMVNVNPFSHLDIKIQTPSKLPRVIPKDDLLKLFRFIYSIRTPPQAKSAFLLARNRTIVELLLATGIRVAELCSIDVSDIDIEGGLLRIVGKGNKERCIQIENPNTVKAICDYINLRSTLYQDISTPYLFLNKNCGQLSDKGIREMLAKYSSQAKLSKVITPHMFRHTFATCLLEEGVDIRCIQQLLGHASISTTEIYTHVSTAKQRKVMRDHNPRNLISGTYQGIWAT